MRSDNFDSMTNNLRNPANGTFVTSDDSSHLTWNGAIDWTKERGVYNLYVHVAGGEGNVKQAVDVSLNEMEVDESGSRVSGSLRQVNPKDTERWACFLTVVRRQWREECHQCLRSRHKLSKMSTVPQAMQPIVCGVSIVSKVVDVCHHT